MSSVRTPLDKSNYPDSRAYSFSNWVAKSELAWPIDDVGIRSGVLIVERLRTFGGKLYAAKEHAERFCTSLSLAGDNHTGQQHANAVAEILEEVVTQNHSYLSDDIVVVLLGSPGSQNISKRIVAHIEPVPLDRLANQFRKGTDLVEARNCNVPNESWPIQIKTRSRIAYHLADEYARSVRETAIGLLCDPKGNVTDTSIANVICLTEQNELVSPPRETAFEGISLIATSRFAERMGLKVFRRNLKLVELQSASQIFMTGTTGCIWAVSSLDDREFIAPTENEILCQLQKAWMEELEFDFMDQAVSAP